MGLWCIVLTEAEANAVRGAYTRTDALDPREATDGTWMVPLRVMADIAERAPSMVKHLWPKPLRECEPQDFVGGDKIDAASLALVDAAEAERFARMSFPESDPRAALLADIRAEVGRLNVLAGKV